MTATIRIQTAPYEVEINAAEGHRDVVLIRPVHGTSIWNAWRQLHSRRDDKYNHLRLLGTWDHRPTTDQVLAVSALNTGITACGDARVEDCSDVTGWE